VVLGPGGGGGSGQENIFQEKKLGMGKCEEGENQDKYRMKTGIL
jgi:hypothetical protein